MNKISKDIVVIYHGDCPDGFGGAWSAWKKFGDEADYIPGHFNEDAPDGLKDKDIYFIDFAYPEDVILGLIKDNKKVIIIDHHFSRESLIRRIKDSSYSIDNSGSVLAWKYFHPDKSMPRMLEYIEDRDLYKWELPNSRAVGIFIDSFSQDFKTWDNLVDNIEDEAKFQMAIEKGQVIVKYEAELIEKLINAGAKLVNFEGYEIFVINAPHEFASDIGNILCLKKPPFAAVWSEENDLIRVSLRSSRDSNFDVSSIAAKYGGGGHKSASGFRLPVVNSFPWKTK